MGKNGKSSKDYRFDLDNPILPPEIDEKALTSGGYPYDEKLKKKVYEQELMPLQLELLKLGAHLEAHGERLVVVFEGRDASGKGSCISRFLERMNPRQARSVALSKPTEVERGQWYFQRYVAHLPTAGDLVLFDRSWYNRAGVERVMGFCTEDQVEAFFRAVPDFEGLLVQDGIHFFKFYLSIGREMQLKRFHERRHDPFKRWKITEIDLAAIDKWDAYTRAQEDIFSRTSTNIAPWTMILANDQRRARLESISTVLAETKFDGKYASAVGRPDPKIVGSGPKFFDRD
jgi:polyphosphate kinase 2